MRLLAMIRLQSYIYFKGAHHNVGEWWQVCLQKSAANRRSGDDCWRRVLRRLYDDAGRRFLLGFVRLVYRCLQRNTRRCGALRLGVGNALSTGQCSGSCRHNLHCWFAVGLDATIIMLRKTFQ